MAAAMQHPSDNAVNSQTAQRQAAAGVQGSRVATQGPTQFAQGNNSAADTVEPVFIALPIIPYKYRVIFFEFTMKRL
ncbi:hypothetical protein AZE42_09045 [Rhizopogon vesiculosus]|uniref:Uncharacterized protein n=1 Tax=Rhizopogon vesiculosus TaxID=180088 RepID=A0A1J8QPQ8_9AGAM|nr:hypothetical protein AZE42_09045 [Rhizopogon vesiculosus]